MTAPWHVTDALAHRYASGAAAEPDAWSLEKHVEVCGDCAVRVSAAVRAGGSGPVLADVRASLLATVRAEPTTAPRRLGAGSRPSGGPGLGAGLGLSPASRGARLLWAVGPALRGAWVVALLVVVAAAVGLAYGAGFRGARPALLALAPVLPLAGVAVSYGRHADPMYEIGVATPSGGLRLLLTRAAAVLGVCVPALTAAGAVLPPVTGVPGAAAWLLPGLALTLAALALGSFVGCRAASATLAAGWLLAVTGPVLGRPGASAELARYLSGPAAQGGWAAAAAVCAGLVALRRRSFDHLETR
ncbi:zf-HC2 domain-containing protein [Streptomyces sp. NPDC046237]|uniref:zf-HC2 domain-containing protein n=1 Tax=Streptomyces sp. NPDC046237 TaxID=3154914 RepID=UPI0033EC2BF5